jgi:hypothetical protein
VLQQAGLAGLTRIRMVGLRDGRLLVSGAVDARAEPRGFIVDLSRASVEQTGLTRGPDRLLALEDGTFAELDGYGLSLLRFDVRTEFDDVPAPLGPGAPLSVALDLATRWQREGAELQALEDARFDLPHVRFSSMRLRMTLTGSWAVLLEPAAHEPLRVELTDDALALGRCRTARVPHRPVEIERAGDRLWLRAGSGEHACELPPELGRVSVAFEARAGARAGGLEVTRR